jgi:hypothetical protein
MRRFDKIDGAYLAMVLGLAAITVALYAAVLVTT